VRAHRSGNEDEGYGFTTEIAETAET